MYYRRMKIELFFSRITSIYGEKCLQNSTIVTPEPMSKTSDDWESNPSVTCCTALNEHRVICARINNMQSDCLH